MPILFILVYLPVIIPLLFALDVFLRFTGLTLSPVFAAIWFLIKNIIVPVVGISGFVWLVLRNKKELKQYIMIFPIIAIVWSVGVFAYTLHPVYMETIPAESIASMKVVERYYDKDSKVTGKYAISTDDALIDNLMRAVQDKKLRKIKERDLNRNTTEGFEFEFVLYDENEKEISTLYFYNEMQFSVEKEEKTKYYEFRENHVNFEVMNQLIK